MLTICAICQTHLPFHHNAHLANIHNVNNLIVIVHAHVVMQFQAQDSQNLTGK